VLLGLRVRQALALQGQQAQRVVQVPRGLQVQLVLQAPQELNILGKVRGQLE